MTKFKVSFNAIGLNGIFRDRNQYLDENEVLYSLTENNQKQITVTIEADTEEKAESKSKSLIHKSLAKICFAFHEEGSIIQEGCSIKDLDNPDKLTSVCKSLTLRFNIEDKNSKQPGTIVSMMESLNPAKKIS